MDLQRALSALFPPFARAGAKGGFFIWIRPETPGFLEKEGKTNMETRIAGMGIIVENTQVTEKLNGILHEYGTYIVGRIDVYKRQCLSRCSDFESIILRLII